MREASSVQLRTGTVIVVAPVEPGTSQLLHDGVDRFGGSGCTLDGDALIAEFPAAGLALDAAIALQRAAARSTRVRALRVGVATGDLTAAPEDGGLDGPAVAQAHELVVAAAAGQILATDVVARLDGDVRRQVGPAGVLLHPGGQTRPFETVEIHWSPLPTLGGSVAALPPAVEVPQALPFVGRAAETAQLWRAWASALDGHHQTVVVTGEAGAGKSRVVADFTRTVHDRGALVLWGSCGTATDVPFQPFAEALRPVVAVLDHSARAALLGDRVDDLALLLPRLVERSGPAPDVEAGIARAWMFETLVDLLTGLGERNPVLLVIDDLHWARLSTALLTAHLATDPGRRRLCLVTTMRDTVDDQTDAARGLLGDLARQSGVHRITVEGLAVAELAELVTQLVGHSLDDDLRSLVEHLARVSGGNPFLVSELWRHLTATGRVARAQRRWRVHGDLGRTASPTTVREVIGQRLEGLGTEGSALLRIAALAGSPFDARLVARAAGLDTGASAALDAALSAGLLVEEDGPGVYRFRHELVAQAVADGIAPNARRAIHLALAGALEVLEPDRLHLIARHLTRAVPLVDPALPANWARRAAQRALQANAYDDAASTLADALTVVEDPALCIDLLAELSHVSACSSDLTRSVAAADEAADLARQVGDDERLAAAANLYYEAHWRSDGRIDGRPELVEAALAVAQGTTRARLLVSRATSLAFDGRDDDAVAVGAEAIELARRSGDDTLLNRVMHGAMFAGWRRPESLQDRFALAMEATAIARRAGDDEGVLRNLLKVVFGASALGEGDLLRRSVLEIQTLAERLRQPWLLVASDAVVSLCALAAGDLRSADAGVEAFDAHGRRIPDAPEGLGLLMFAVRREQGRLAELRPVAELMARLGQDQHTWRPGLAALYAEVGLHDEAKDLLDRVCAGGQVDVPHDYLRPVSLSFLSDACAVTSHDAASLVHRALSPWSGYAIWAPAIACYGAADRYLGRLAVVSGRLDQARAHLEAAVRFDERAGWATWRAHSRTALGAFLLEHGRRNEEERGRDEVRAARNLASRHGLEAIVERCDALLAGNGPTERAVSLSTRELQVVQLMAAGLTNREIGERLHTSRHTVANQIHSILVKTGCTNRTETIAWAHRHGAIG